MIPAKGEAEIGEMNIQKGQLIVLKLKTVNVIVKTRLLSFAIISKNYSKIQF